ncbi:3-methyl-2-oxobutanoate hydroxymethyltransferase [Dethiosulfatarculus sandiegensis]|uniref:3-methyl-2-oxobutanoate hydroxymethyltransferase n=1 Tax=Dethiosulfatarculus sandiegensis TaxID=1429043 RepID=A0A0D2JX70_9BACT|nr:3-methyl-2-oxobutanoate hydroxymethyltransferase [Dethiosulfatarculus sandiegensis]KIX14185.1 3-methyl-2-oxobutanoate hydroxymethyltransferase [Dethiosulfatarculus sandiegensis]
MAETASKKRPTIPSIKQGKGSGRRVTMITVYDYPFARLVDQSEAEMILVGDSLGMVIQGGEHTNPVTLDEIIYHAKAVRRGAPNTLVVGDMPFMSYQLSPEQALASAGRQIKEAGVDCVKMEGGEYLAPYVHKLVQAGIPVVGHIGLTPQSASALGGFKVQGKTEQEAEQLVKDAIALDQAGVFAMVLECIPAGVAKVITEKVNAVTMGVGAGPHTDGQNLNAYDILGLFDSFVPKFVEQYQKLAPLVLDGFNSFARQVKDGSYPQAAHSFTGGETIKGLYPTE